MLPKEIRAFSSVGRAFPLQGKGHKFESYNAHHKNPNDICCLDFYFVCYGVMSLFYYL